MRRRHVVPALALAGSISTFVALFGAAGPAAADEPVTSATKVKASAPPIAQAPTVTAATKVKASASAPKAAQTVNAVSEVDASIPAPVSVEKTKSGPASPKLSAKLRTSLSKARPLSPGVKAELLDAAGLVAHAGVGGPTQLTVRDPYAGSQAFMSFIGAAVVNPAEGARGTAAINGDPRVAGAIPSSAFGNPFGPMIVTAPPDNAVIVDFRAQPDTHYVVECTWASPEPPPQSAGIPSTPVTASSFYSHVRDGGTTVTGGLAVRGAAIVQLVPAGSSSRRVVVKIKADARFLTTGCAITPASAG